MIKEEKGVCDLEGEKRMNQKTTEILHILEKNGRVSLPALAKMVNLPEEEVKGIVQQLEEDRVILGYSTVIDWSKVEKQEGVTAVIDVKVTPQRGVGFNEVAERIYRFPQVSSVYLMSGAYDLSVVIEGDSMNEIARFVSEKLATIDSVLSTTTHFKLKKYKHDGVVFEQIEKDHRMLVTP